MNDDTKKKLRKAAIIGGGAALGAGAVALASPFVRKELANFIRTRGNVHASDFSKSIPKGALKDADEVLDVLHRAGVDPANARIAVTGAGGTGKTTFSKALAARSSSFTGRREIQSRGVHVHGGFVHKNLDHEVKRGLLGWDFSKYKPKKGTISEQTHLLSQSDPDNYDVLIHLEKPVDAVKKQLLKRGKGATQYEVENYELLQKNLRNAFEYTDGKAVQARPHIRVKVRPKGGFNADKRLDSALQHEGIKPTSSRRSDKLLSLSQGAPSTYRNIPSYLRKDRAAYLAAGAGAGGTAANKMYGEKKAEYRTVRIGGKTIDLDTEIPLITDLPSSAVDLRDALKSHIQKAKSTRWSHPQIAIPASVDLMKLKDAATTRLAIPLPGEAIGTQSLRAGRLHSHTQGPVHLIHLDGQAPGGPISAIKHAPEAVRALIARRSAEPFVKSAAEKLRVLYIDETGAGHRAQANNVVRAARKMGIDAEAVDFADTFLKKKRDGKEYRQAYLNFLSKKSVDTLPRLAQAHLRYHRGVDPKKRARFLKKNEDAALLLAHPHLEHQFRDLDRSISVMHTDPVKWPLQIPVSSGGKRLHIGASGVVGDMRTPHKKEVSGLAVHEDLLKKRMSRSGLMRKKDFNVTVSAGGEALEVPEIVEQVLKSDLPDNAVVHAVAGRRKDVLKKLQAMAKKDKRLQPHGFAPLPKMMREADLNVIRAHGTSYAETLTSGKPAVYYGPSRHLLDFQGALTRGTAVHGGKETKYPVAVGLGKIPEAVNEAQRNYKGLRRQAQKLQKGYGNPAAQIALAAVKEAKAPRDYKQEYAEYHGKPDQVSNRSLRNQARRRMGLKKGDPREVDHKTPISKGGGNGKDNLRAISRRANRTKFTDRS